MQPAQIYREMIEELEIINASLNVMSHYAIMQNIRNIHYHLSGYIMYRDMYYHPEESVLLKRISGTEF